jgi:hypothetical protein
MKLRGTKTESEYRAMLIESKDWIRSADGALLSKCLDDLGYDSGDFFILSHLPEQLEDSYLVFDGDKMLLDITISRGPRDNPVIEQCDIENYEKANRRQTRIQLKVARELRDDET